MRLRRLPVRDFLGTEAAGGVLVIAALLVALALANSPLSGAYEAFWTTETTIGVGDLALTMDLRHVVNDLLMALFFFVIGLEVKREVTTGELATRSTAALPIIAALGGMVVPAAIYFALNPSGPGSSGWAVPVATDIAIALAVLSVASRSLATGSKTFLLALAVVDDIVAILLIAALFTDDISVPALLLSVLLLALMIMAWRTGLRWLPGFVFMGLAVWLAVHESGVHATIAGAVIGLLVPVRPALAPGEADEEKLLDVSTPDAALETVTLARNSVSLIEWLEHKLHPWASFMVLPLFALANGGISIDAESVAAASASTVTLGVILGLVLGKPLGIVGATLLATRLGIGTLPAHVSTRELVGLGAIAGIGFTVAVFVAGLALPEELVAEAKIGILVASVVAAAVGAVLLRGADRPEG